MAIWVGWVLALTLPPTLAACMMIEAKDAPAILTYRAGSSVQNYDEWHRYAYQQNGIGEVDVGCSIFVTPEQELNLATFFTDGSKQDLAKLPAAIQQLLREWKNGGAAVVLHRSNGRSLNFIGSGYVYQSGEIRRMSDADRKKASHFAFSLVEKFECANWTAEPL